MQTPLGRLRDICLRGDESDRTCVNRSDCGGSWADGESALHPRQKELAGPRPADGLPSRAFCAGLTEGIRADISPRMDPAGRFVPAGLHPSAGRQADLAAIALEIVRCRFPPRSPAQVRVALSEASAIARP